MTADDNGPTDGPITFMIVNNTGGGTNTGGTMTTGGGATTDTLGGGTLPQSGEPTGLPLSALALAALVLGTGLVLRRRALSR